MENSFLVWTGPLTPSGTGEFGSWIPVLRQREGCGFEATIRVQPLVGWLNDVSPLPESCKLDVAILAGTIDDSQRHLPDLGQPCGSNDFARDDLPRAEVRIFQGCDSSNRQIVRVGVIPSAPRTAEQTERSKPVDSWLFVSLRHNEAIPQSAAGRGSALVRIFVAERIRGVAKKDTFFSISALPGFCQTRLNLPTSGSESIEPKELSVRVAIDGDPDPRFPDVVLVHNGKITPEAHGCVRFTEAKDALIIKPLGPEFISEHRLGIIQIECQRPNFQIVTVNSPNIEWTDSSLGRLLTFAQKTGWRPKGRVVQAGEQWNLHGGSNPDDRSGNTPFWMILSGYGTWPLAAYPEMSFAAPCLLGAPPLIPESKRDHERRAARLKRVSGEVPSNSTPTTDDREKRWFVARTPLLANPGEATANSTVEMLEFPFNPSVHRYYTETWIDDELHESLRYRVAGRRKWDVMLGTLHSYCGSVFRHLQPTETDGSYPPKWPLTIGRLVPIAVPVASPKHKYREFETVYAATATFVRSDIPNHPIEFLTDRRRKKSLEKKPPLDKAAANAASRLQSLPAGCVMKRGEIPAGIIVVPTGFVVMTQNFDRVPNTQPIISGAARTPRMFGELECSGALAPNDESDTDARTKALANVFYFRDGYPEDDSAKQRPLRLSVAFLVAYEELEQDGKVYGELRLAIRERSRRMVNAVWREALFFAHHPVRSMETWLFRVWRNAENPSTENEALEVPDLLLSAVLHTGEPVNTFDVEAMLDDWKAGQKSEKEKKAVESLHAYSDARLEGVSTRAQYPDGDWALLRRSYIRHLPRLLVHKGILQYTRSMYGDGPEKRKDKEPLEGFLSLVFAAAPLRKLWKRERG